MEWMALLTNLASGFLGVLIGAIIVAYRAGAKFQKLEDRIMAAEERLKRGNRHVDQVPILRERIDVVITEVKEIKALMREAFQQFQTKAVCDERHR